MREAVESAARVRKEGRKVLTFTQAFTGRLPMRRRLHRGYRHRLGDEKDLNVIRQTRPDAPAALCTGTASRQGAYCHALLAAVWVCPRRERLEDKADCTRGWYSQVLQGSTFNVQPVVRP